MNEDISERFNRVRKPGRIGTVTATVVLEAPRLNTKIREYVEAVPQVSNTTWLNRPEIPSSEEILDVSSEESSSSDVVELVPNRPKGKWDNKEQYLSTQYELLREDAVRSLREAVARVRFTPAASEDAFNGAIGIYEKVYIRGITCSTRGIATRVSFSLFRTGKRIIWEQSKRLITGNLVVLTPRDDMFQSKAIVATVAARPLSALQQNPPEIDLFIARVDEQELDPTVEFVMVEDRGGLYEANKHTLSALQRMMNEPFPLSSYIVRARSSVTAPQYLRDMPIANLMSVFTNSGNETYENVDILNGWPDQPQCDFDATQLASLHRILTKRLAIIQGPPGTGKTFMSVKAIKVMLANRKADDPPIIIACQTNHAIDQILRHIAEFEKDFIRLGGRSKDKDIIKSRTLYEVRSQSSEPPVAGSYKQQAKKRMKKMEAHFGTLLSPLEPRASPLDFRLCENIGLLTKPQADSLEDGASAWVQAALQTSKGPRSPFTVWLGQSLVPVPPKQVPEDFGFDYEEADLEFEQLKDLEAENVAKDDEDFETLIGPTFYVAENFTCNVTAPTTDAAIRESLKKTDMWDIPPHIRPSVYNYLQREVKKMVLAALIDKARTFNNLAVQRRIGIWEQDEAILKKQKIIGMTTTGFSKYRALITALEPRIVLIEEAAETLEAPVTVTCVPSLQHLILVGDHKQLRPHTHLRAHEDHPFFLNVSLFERLVNNKIEHTTMSGQRRMIPEIRRLLHPIYGNLIEDHDYVLDPVNRPDVAGMGGVNSFFFTHQWPEQRDEQMSAYNPQEADMIVAFVEYLNHNGIPAKDITILTFYNGQRKTILKKLHERGNLDVREFAVVTVDSYQGEENKVVLLSLVRSNDKGQIGFLDVENRVCVALSRAQCGFYIFGNAPLLHDHKLWKKVISIMANNCSAQDRLKTNTTFRIDDKLPLVCSNHNNKTKIGDASDFDNLAGGCDIVPCKGTLPCGHECELLCHPFPHERVICQRPCRETLVCGHPCSQPCSAECACNKCKKGVARTSPEDSPTRTSSAESWASFAKAEPARYAAAASAPPPRQTSSQKNIEDLERGMQVISVDPDETGLSDDYVLIDVADGESTEGSQRAKAKVKFVPRGKEKEVSEIGHLSNRQSLLD